MADEPDFPTEHLDLARGLAALAVATWHWRSFFFRPYDAARSSGPLEALFYFVTGFSREAVMVFFVLSGYFITRSVARDLALGRWSWRRYFVARGTRLYLVLVPALVLGAAWDAAGLAAFGPGSMYGGREDVWGPLVVNWSVAHELSLQNFVGCLAFLQTLYTWSLGSNGALWSLAYEGWYYVLFPLGLFGLRPGTPIPVRVACLAGVAAIVPFVGNRVIGMGAVWLLGALLAVTPVRRLPRWTVAASGLALLGALAAARAGLVTPVWGERGVALAFGALLYALTAATKGHPGTRYARLSAGLADCSYTLYLVHMPMLLFLGVWATGGARWSPEPGRVAIAATALLAALGYAWIVAKGTEAHTGRVRAWVMRHVTPRSPGGRMGT